jgi:hypothetical protein
MTGSAARASNGCPVLGIDPFSAKFLGDTYPFHEQLREAGPVVWLERYECWGWRGTSRLGKPRYVRHSPPRRRTRRLRRRPFMNALARRWCAWRPNWCSLRATKRVETFEIAGEPKQRFNNTLRGLVSLPVRVGRALRRGAKYGIQT